MSDVVLRMGITKKEQELIDRIRKDKGVTKVAVVRQALSVYALILNQQEADNILIFQDARGNNTRVIIT